MKINVVLFQPQIPQNTGNIARTCAATGANLHIVGPMGFKIDDKKLKRAGLDYWKYLNVKEYQSTQEFFKKHTDSKFYYFSTKASNLYTKPKYEQDVYLVFGREDAGLSEQLLKDNKQTSVRIPMGETIRSLNLSNSVAIAVYEVLRQWDFAGLKNFGSLTG